MNHIKVFKKKTERKIKREGEKEEGQGGSKTERGRDRERERREEEITNLFRREKKSLLTFPGFPQFSRKKKKK